MTSVAHGSVSGAANLRRADARSVTYWLSLGAAAGGLGGFLVGGIGGRLAMFVLRLTSDDSVLGIQSDDDFTIGRFDFFSTLNLLFLTAVLGAIVGLIVVAGRPFLPRRGMPLAWALAGAITGGAILINKDGVDFTLLEPHALAVALFMVIPAVGAGLICWMTEVFPRFWWKQRKLTMLLSVASLPLMIVFPVAIFAVLVGVAWWLVMRIPISRKLPRLRIIRVAAVVVFALVVALGLNDLIGDVPAIV